MNAVYLRSVTPSRNRFRAFTLAETRTLFGEPALFITWGRLGTKPRSRVEAFASEAAMDARREALLQRRRAHGYTPCWTVVVPREPLR